MDSGVNKKKSRIAYVKFILLGHRLGPEGVSMVDEKVQELVNWPSPTTGEGVMRFLRCKLYIKDYFLISRPLDALRNEPKKFELP